MDEEVLGGWVVDVGRESHDKIAWLWLFGLKDGIKYLGIEFAAFLVLGWVGIAFSVADGLFYGNFGFFSDNHARVGMV